jgi:hypothetical protein
MANSSNLAAMMKEETTSKQLTELMKELVQTITAPEDTRKRLREKIDEVCGNKREKEHSRKVEEFMFRVPTKSIEKWSEELRNVGTEPTKDIHFKTENSINYINIAKKSWTVNVEAEAWKAVDDAKGDFERKEDRRLDALKEGEEKTRKTIFFLSVYFYKQLENLTILTYNLQYNMYYFHFHIQCDVMVDTPVFPTFKKLNIHLMKL